MWTRKGTARTLRSWSDTSNEVTLVVSPDLRLVVWGEGVGFEFIRGNAAIDPNDDVHTKSLRKWVLGHLLVHALLHRIRTWPTTNKPVLTCSGATLLYSRRHVWRQRNKERRISTRYHDILVHIVRQPCKLSCCVDRPWITVLYYPRLYHVYETFRYS